MSAFVVADEHIDYLISAGLEYAHYDTPLRWHIPDNTTDPDLPEVEREHELTEHNASRIGQMLLAENVNSANHRYDENELDTFYEFHRVTVDPVQTLKAINCYSSNSCEHDGWATSNAQRFIDALRRAAIEALPGYEDAAWEIFSIEDAESPSDDNAPRKKHP